MEEYGSGAKLAVMCPATPLWQDTIATVVDTISSSYAVDGVYSDQVFVRGLRVCGWCWRASCMCACT